MTLPRWVKVPFYRFARIRFVISNVIIFILIALSIKNNWPWEQFWTLVFFQAAFCIQGVLEFYRADWETDKFSYNAHIRRHKIYFISLVSFYTYSQVVFFHYWFLEIFVFLIVFEFGTIIRHLLDPENVPGALAPAAPI